jgi:hypothetical protein
LTQSQLIPKSREASEGWIDTMVSKRTQRLSEAGTPANVRSALHALLDIERELNRLVHRRIHRNRFWRAILADPKSVSRRVYVGTVLENYHFLKSEPVFDGPALTFSGSATVRSIFNQFFCDEFGHDKMLHRALLGAGLDRREIDSAIPLPSTSALINVLAYWARYDAKLFFATIGLHEGREGKIDSFVEACEKKSMPRAFVKPVRAHALINVRSAHGSVARILFREMGALSDEEIERIRTSLPLFVRLYDDFYEGIWHHYSDERKPVIRTLESYLQ